MRQGAKAYLTKPFSEDELASDHLQHLGSARGSAAAPPPDRAVRPGASRPRTRPASSVRLALLVGRARAAPALPVRRSGRRPRLAPPGKPRPRRRSLRPASESAGILSSTGPPSVGTLTVAPNAASHGATGSTWMMLRPSTSNCGCAAYSISSSRSPCAPCPPSRITCPGLHALGHAHVQRLAVDADAHAVAAVDRFQRHRQLGARVASRWRARAVRTPAARRRPNISSKKSLKPPPAPPPAKISSKSKPSAPPLAEAARRRMDFVAGPIATRAQLVVGRALLRIAQRLVGLVDAP